MLADLVSIVGVVVARMKQGMEFTRSFTNSCNTHNISHLILSYRFSSVRFVWMVESSWFALSLARSPANYHYVPLWALFVNKVRERGEIERLIRSMNGVWGAFGGQQMNQRPAITQFVWYSGVDS